MLVTASLKTNNCLNAITNTNTFKVLQWVPCVWYPVQIQKVQIIKIKTLIHFKSEVNTTTPAYIAKLSLSIQKIQVDFPKIDGTALEIYGIVRTIFLFQDTLEKVWFFEETFLLTNTSIETILWKLFFSLSKADVSFNEKNLLKDLILF